MGVEYDDVDDDDVVAVAAGWLLFPTDMLPNADLTADIEGEGGGEDTLPPPPPPPVFAFAISAK